MPLWHFYHRPQSIDEALALLDRYAGRAQIVSGGTDLLLDMQQGHHPPVDALVDVTAIEEMNQVGLSGDHIEVGAAVSHTTIVQTPLLVERATCLVESCGVIGGPQVRNVATLGGNVGHALPAADGTTALVALDAEAEIASAAGRSWQPILDLFEGPGQSTVDSSRAFITRFRFPAGAPGKGSRAGSAFKRIMRPQGVALPILACAVWLHLEDPLESHLGDSSTAIRAARICIGPVGPVPRRILAAEKALTGLSLDDVLEACVAAAQAECSPRTSRHRATAAYRQELIAVLLRRAVPLAYQRALTGQAVPEGVGLA
jgi:CO/xanthine dehydrogenase FAD-binding subunit